MNSSFKSLSTSFTYSTSGKGTYEITDLVHDLVKKSEIQNGTVTVFITHTSASLIIYENADPSARTDLHRYFEKIAPENDPDYIHTAEGPDDMPSHLRMGLTRTSEVIPISRGKMTLGTWQGIFLFEHRSQPHRRTISVNIMGI
jgi:secondary thiamine-phosphate synthase enzyme